jgi:hypothetical protein
VEIGTVLPISKSRCFAKDKFAIVVFKGWLCNIAEEATVVE